MSTVPPEIVLDHIQTLICRVAEFQEKGMNEEADLLLAEAKHMTGQLDKDQTLTYFL